MWSGDAEWPKVADAVIEAVFSIQLLSSEILVFLRPVADKKTVSMGFLSQEVLNKEEF